MSSSVRIKAPSIFRSSLVASTQRAIHNHNHRRPVPVANFCFFRRSLSSSSSKYLSDKSVDSVSMSSTAAPSDITLVAEDTKKVHSVLDSSFPVYLPADPALFLPEDEFQAHLQRTLINVRKAAVSDLKDKLDNVGEGETSPGAPKSKVDMDVDDKPVEPSPFIEALKKHEAHVKTEEQLLAENKTLTENADVTNVSAKNPLVDLFYDLSQGTTGERLETLLQNAWNMDALMTLKIIFNSRSIHLGKSDKFVAYKAFGWLAEHHPATLLANLRWLVRPVIEKKTKKAKAKSEDGKGETVDEGKTVAQEEDDFEMVDAEQDPEKTSFDVQFGVSHGYWKDLLNILALAANDQLSCHSRPESLLIQVNNKYGSSKRKREFDPQKAKEVRKQVMLERYQRVLKKLETDDFYRSLHQLVARLFAEQLQIDAMNLKSSKKSDQKKVSLAAKWAPTFGEFHDKHTFIQTSIAEIMFPNPQEICPDATNRELYIRYAREAYRKTISSPLRKALEVVERDIAANRFDQIKYDRVPSLAMDRYVSLFLNKDTEHFTKYIDKVAVGEAKISGAVLLPSTLVAKARGLPSSHAQKNPHDLKAAKAAISAGHIGKILDGQWNTLVQRIRDSGTLDNSIAVCDVSGSMEYSPFRPSDKTTPMDSSIGLSLLLAEVTAPPFGGHFITFSADPQLVSVGGPNDTRTFVDKVHYILNASWGMNTDFVAVFERLILPTAIANKIPQEQMVKRIFVFSDMQFDCASIPNRWTTSYERIKKMFEEAGYEIPELVFWNLAAEKTDKPVTSEDNGTALVSGYSQGMLKSFLDGAGFEGEEGEEVVEEVVNEDGTVEVKVKKQKEKMDPFTVVKKAVSHKAYDMLQVVD
ncbi:hypothetical protein BU24DRAFT_417618 [Aaosphaeria arxii CBS 175.79]|uniref:Uncharacterized protein n=1 Tax=Aaosphaeria arxii CBS 175.79 TaxID=1450172 RepID=A0A6A5YBH9_9PLEO|nr:uncharacterized protein BU24DRAFT_417618 [Aaosphaeria arxii CBS 175.79]KAF2021974.1 hypothetical protein BU24DRAFT_417618 [Aaosphaeria arxii CBS 175.79]